MRKKLSIWKRALLVVLAAIIALAATLAVLYRDLLFRDTGNLDLSGSESAISILFVGNSHVFWGKLPKQLYIVSKMYGIDVAYKDISRNGAHLTSLKDDAIREMRNGNYYYAVLQDNTRLLPGNNKESLHAIKILCDEARANGVVPVIYVPLGANKNGRPDPGRQSIFTEAFRQAADENDAVLVDAGEAWIYAYDTVPEVSLYAWDGMHPNYGGAFLTANVFAATLFDLRVGEVPEGSLYNGSDAALLAQAACEYAHKDSF